MAPDRRGGTWLRLMMHPRMVAWGVLAFVLLLGERLLVGWAYVIPHTVAFRPGFVLIPLMGMYWGPAAVIGGMLASVAGDGLLGWTGPLVAYRALGVGAAALAGAVTKRDHSVFGAAGAVLPACLLHAAWVGLGSAAAGWYPFGHVFAAQFLVNLAPCLILFLPAYRAMMGGADEFETWRELTEAPPKGPHRWVAGLIWVSAGVAGLGGWLIHGWFVGPWVGNPDRLGCHTPAAFLLFLAAGLLAPLAGMVPFRRPLRSPPPSSTGPMRSFYLPPIEKR